MYDLLPVVREGTYESVAASVCEDFDKDGEFINAYLTHIEKVNPQILIFILHWVRTLEGKRLVHAIIGLCAVYKLLESESEARIFEKEMEKSNGDN